MEEHTDIVISKVEKEYINIVISKRGKSIGQVQSCEISDNPMKIRCNRIRFMKDKLNMRHIHYRNFEHLDLEILNEKGEVVRQFLNYCFVNSPGHSYVTADMIIMEDVILMEDVPELADEIGVIA